ncbi:unnamed protein product [Calypogeia fissa]
MGRGEEKRSSGNSGVGEESNGGDEQIRWAGGQQKFNGGEAKMLDCGLRFNGEEGMEAWNQRCWGDWGSRHGMNSAAEVLDDEVFDGRSVDELGAGGCYGVGSANRESGRRMTGISGFGRGVIAWAEMLLFFSGI